MSWDKIQSPYNISLMNQIQKLYHIKNFIHVWESLLEAYKERSTEDSFERVKSYLKFLISFFIWRKRELYSIIQDNIKSDPIETMNGNVTVKVNLTKLDPNTKMFTFFRAYMSFCHQIKLIVDEYSFKEIFSKDTAEQIAMPKQLHYSLFEMLIWRDHII